MVSPTPSLPPVADEIEVPRSVDSLSLVKDTTQHSFHSSDEENGAASAAEHVGTSLTQIPVPACDSGTVHAVLHSSNESEEIGQDGLRKKSVSFSERVFYHSPHGSPRRSASEGDRLLNNIPLSLPAETVTDINGNTILILFRIYRNCSSGKPSGCWENRSICC